MSMKQNNKVKVSVSYSWEEEKQGENKGSVATCCKELEDYGVEVVRDKEQKIEYGEDIYEQMRCIGASGFLCVFLSKGYLLSRKCMYEMLVAWQTSIYNRE